MYFAVYLFKSNHISWKILKGENALKR